MKYKFRFEIGDGVQLTNIKNISQSNGEYSNVSYYLRNLFFCPPIPKRMIIKERAIDKYFRIGDYWRMVIQTYNRKLSSCWIRRYFNDLQK